MLCITVEGVTEAMTPGNELRTWLVDHVQITRCSEMTLGDMQSRDMTGLHVFSLAPGGGLTTKRQEGLTSGARLGPGPQLCYKYLVSSTVYATRNHTYKLSKRITDSVLLVIPCG